MFPPPEAPKGHEGAPPLEEGYAKRETQQPGNGKIIGAYVLAALSVVTIPVLFGPLAIWLSGKADRESHPAAQTARMVSIVCMIAGFALRVIVRLQ